MDATNNNRIRVAMFPWLAYGHITPYFELAKKLASRGLFIIYMCSTPATLGCIENKINQTLSHSIKLVPLHLPTSPGLPPNFHTTNGLPGHLIPKLMEALNASVDDFSAILADLKPDLLVYDIFQSWASFAAKEQNIPAIEFVTSGAASTCHLYHQLDFSSTEFPFPMIYHRDFDDKTWLLDTASDLEKKNKVLEGARMSSKIVLIKASREIEGKYIDYLASLVGKKYVPVGPLVREPSPENEKDDEVMSWLEKKERKSTVFVSFGSECFITKEDIYEIAYGLQLSKVDFVWVVRFPKGENGRNIASLETALPKGFLERVGDKGIILDGWGPQTKILGHANVGGFVSHCGWNSVIESMHFGVPIIAMPMHVDQPINARLVEEIGVGVEVLRDKDRRFRRETLAAVIKQVVMEGSGERVRRRAAEMREKLKCKGDEEIDEVVKELVGLCNKS